MTGTLFIRRSSFNLKHFPVLDMRDCYTCSFTEFLPFTSAMFYFSSFKAFKKITPAQQIPGYGDAHLFIY